MNERKVLGVGLVGAGFIAQFHLQAWRTVRDADIVAVVATRLENAERLAREVEKAGLGTNVAAYDDVTTMVRDDRVDAVWVLSPNDVRVENVARICAEATAGRTSVRGIAVEKPIGRTVDEARQVLDLVTNAGLSHAYLENQVYAPSVQRAHEILWRRGASDGEAPYLARCAEEHSGPHKTWFWNAAAEGGGVLMDMMCHSIEAGRYLLTPPGEKASSWLKPIAVNATIASLKWSQERYARDLARQFPGVSDYTKAPSEDYAHALFEFETNNGTRAVVEATTSWCYVGPGLRLSFELLGPEYSMAINTLGSDTSVFMSRRIGQGDGEDLIEKQNAEQGLMPVIADEAQTYGYAAEDAAIARAFVQGEQPAESLVDGVEVMELVMAAYLSAERGGRVELPVDLSGFVPAVVSGDWRP